MKKLLLALVVSLLLSASVCSASELDDGTNQYFDDPRTYTQEEWDQICYGTPDDVLISSTEDLFEFFYESAFLVTDVVGRSGPSDTRVIDYTKHPAFAELITRSDFLSVLDRKTAEVLSDANSFLGSERINAILRQPSVVELLCSADSCNEQDSLFVQGADNREQFVFNTITYTSSGSVYTVNGLSVPVYTASREWTQNEQALLDSYWSSLTPVYHASTRFNCHSYAWYKMAFNNNYWIEHVGLFIGDNACTLVSPSSVQVDDIIVYRDGSQIRHSGVVYSVNGNNITICSKWGQLGVYIHSISNVPPTYLDSTTGMPNVVYYRYHDYSNQYIGQEYHSGSYHYYRFADVCTICGKRINFTWHSYPCSGPPCSLLFRNYLTDSRVGLIVD